MTVCIAGLFRWNYGSSASPNTAVAGLAVSDRMITAADVQYEPSQQKAAMLGQSGFVLVAGDIAVHTEAIQQVQNQVRGRQAAPADLAAMYGRAIQSVNLRHAETAILAPLNLNTDTFHAQQRDFSETFVNTITNQLQQYRGPDVEALVLASNGSAVELYSVDSSGGTNAMTDLGFGAIGIGAWHAKSSLMQSGYTNGLGLAEALAAVYAAKKRSETAPGVGAFTDINLVLRDQIFPIWPRVVERLHVLYTEYESRRTALAQQAVNELLEFIITPPEGTNDEAEGRVSANAQTNDDAGANEAEDTRGNEDRQTGEGSQKAE